MSKAALGGIFAALIAMTAPAMAVPFAGVNTAYWNVEFHHYNDLNGNISQTLPGGIFISCFGAGSFGNHGCQSSAGLIVNEGSALLSQTGGFTVTNNNNFDLPGGLSFISFFSAFNPGGNPIGAQVDDPSYQYASFSSSVIGPAPGIGDFHGCSTMISPNMGPNACGVFSPDSSQGSFGVPAPLQGPLLAGQTVTISYKINIGATVYLPEPLTLSLFGAGLAGAMALRRRRLGKGK